MSIDTYDYTHILPDLHHLVIITNINQVWQGFYSHFYFSLFQYIS